MSEPLSFYFSQVFWPVLLIGAICFLLGLLVGWLIWRNRKAQALEVERKNEKLRSDYGRLQKELKTLEANA